MANITTVKNWFKTGLKPTQAQFWAFFDSIVFKDEQIPAQNIDGLGELLNDKADAEALTNHERDANAHADLFSQINTSGRFLINRNGLMFFADEPITGDTVTGMVEDEYLNAGTFYGGDIDLLSSYVAPTIATIQSWYIGFLSFNLYDGYVDRFNGAHVTVTAIVNAKDRTGADLPEYEEVLSCALEPMSTSYSAFIELNTGSTIRLKDPEAIYMDSNTITYNF